MSTRLDQLLVDLDPRKTIEPAFRRADEALNNYPMPTGRITSWPVFRHCMGKFWNHLHRHIYGAAYGADGFEEWCAGWASQVLKKDYGSNGDIAAFEIARTGNEGGVYGVLRTMARRIATQAAKDWIAMAVDGWWQRLSLPEKLSVPIEYLEKFGHLLPTELTEASAARIRVGFRGVLKEHPWLIQRHRRVGR